MHMLAKAFSCAIIGLDGATVETEVDIAGGLPGLTIVGLPDAAIQESKERVRAAIRNSGLAWPFQRITVNLAPADLRKEGPAYDLPIAVAVLAASEQIWPDRLDGAMFIGELSLDGKVRHTTGILPAAAYARSANFKTAFVPAADANEAALVEGIDIIPVEDLSGLVAHLQGLQPIPPHKATYTLESEPPPYTTDFADVRGQISTQKCQCAVCCEEIVDGGFRRLELG